MQLSSNTNLFGTPQTISRSPQHKKFGTEFDENKKTLVLDLDQTLVYLTVDQPSKEGSFVEILEQGKVKSFAVKRPGLDQFMKEMSAIYNICIYTANRSKYANAVIQAVGLAPYIFEVYTRDHCTKLSEKCYLKSLLNLGLSLSDTIFVDDSAIQMRSQPHNGILIHPFKGETSDSALGYLSTFLQSVVTLPDVRPVTEKLFEFYSQVENNLKRKKIVKSNRSSPKAKDVDLLPLICEETEEDDDDTVKNLKSLKKEILAR